ncbi:MAG TPA: hypothetical protein DCS67_02175 [Clostridiales bacterium UBA8960]|jgi:hypothetical protein|nr:hypothetical protein [Clostridiales bacterium UBA8960]
MLYKIVNRFPEDMIVDKVGPVVSLYQPTHRSFPENKQDLIVFKNLIQVIEKSLEELPNSDLKAAILKPLHALKEDKEFWNHTSDGMAVFASSSQCIVYKLNNPVNELAIVANSFHIKPILKAFQSIENYLLLGLSRENFSLYKGNRYGFENIKIDAEIPRTLSEVLGSQKTDSHLTHGSYNGTGGPAMYHGHGDAQQEIDKDTEKYFRYVDAFVLDHYSKAMKWPLILVSLTEHHSLFKALSSNPYLIEEGIKKSIDSLDLNEIQDKATVIIETINAEKYKVLKESFANAEADAMGSVDLEEIVKAAFESRVDTVYIEEDKIIPGKIDYETGKIKYGDIDHPNYDDVLDDLAEMVLSNGGNAFVLTEDKMPCTTGIAAIYRYKK